jgi:hypothetical protein
MKKEKPLCDSEKALHRIGLYGVVIWNLRHSLLRDLIAMHMAVSLMVIDTQETLTVRKRAFPVVSRGF